jgi:FtsP/CotA-like multicopper oxidase with cupredoxin domain
VVLNGMRTDVANLLPATMQVADRTPDVPATWLYHCHVNDHILAGMQARFLIQPPQGTAGS